MSRAALEAAIDANPDDEQAWSVYADFLVAEGDPRGEIAVAGIHHPERPLPVEHRDLLLGNLKRWSSGNDTFVWRRGFLRGVNLWSRCEVGEPADAVREIFADPSGRFLRFLNIDIATLEDKRDCQPILDEVVAAQPRCLERLTIGDVSPFRMEAGDLDGVLALPRLAELCVMGHHPRLSRSSSSLRKLVLAPTAGAATVQAISAHDWPRLEALSLWLGDESALVDLDGILRGSHFPSLRVLGLSNSTFTDALVDALLHSPILPRLHELLDLSDGTLSDDGAQQLITDKARWAHLDKLDLCDNFLDASIEALRAAGKVAGLGRQRDEDDE